MTTFKIPVSEEPDNTQAIVLEDVSYNLQLTWNTRDEAWYMSIGTVGQRYKIRAKKMTVGLDLLNPYRGYEEIPNGKLVILDRERVVGRVGRNDFGIGKRFELWYETSDGTDLDPIYNP